MENLFVALTNLPVIFPILTAWKKRDLLTAIIIGFVGTASFIFHLAENHKHGMSGIGLSQHTSYYLNKLDVLGCILTVLRFGYLYYNKYGMSWGISNIDIILSLISFIFMMISEYRRQLKWIYILTHAIWHISIYMIMNRILKNFYN